MYQHILICAEFMRVRIEEIEDQQPLWLQVRVDGFQGGSLLSACRKVHKRIHWDERQRELLRELEGADVADLGSGTRLHSCRLELSPRPFYHRFRDIYADD